MFPQINLATARALRAAIDHATEVAKRDWVDADSPNKRVGLFLTSYRSLAKVTEAYHHLASKPWLWSDIGVLSERGRMDQSLQAMLRYAQTLQSDDDLLLAENRKLREDAQQDLKMMQLLISEANQLNSKEEVVLEKMVALYQ